MRLLIAGLALVGCSKKPSEPVVPEPSLDQPLAFAWPDGAVGIRQAQVYDLRVRGDDEEKAAPTRTTETWTVGRSDAGWTIAISDGSFQEFQGGEAPAHVTALAGVEQGFSVDAQGAYRGLVDAQGWSARASAAMAEAVGDVGPLERIQMEVAVQPDAVSGSMQRMWTSLVGHWLGRAPIAGELGAVEGVDPMGTEDPRGAALESRGWVSCGEGRCVELVATADSVPALMGQRSQAALAEWVATLPEEPADAEIADAAEGMEVVVVLDPATMLPHGYTSRVWVSGVARAGEASQPFREERTKAVTWAWTLPGGEE